MQNFEKEFTKWIEKIAAVLRKDFNRDFKTLPYAYELRFFSGYSPTDVLHELELMYGADLYVKKNVSNTLVDQALRS
jgi:hypothetical protein